MAKKINKIVDNVEFKRAEDFTSFDEALEYYLRGTGSHLKGSIERWEKYLKERGNKNGK